MTMKKFILTVMVVQIFGCAAPKLINDNSGKLTYQYPMPIFEKTFADANSRCSSYGKKADLQGQPNCVAPFFDMVPICTASFVCN